MVVWTFNSLRLIKIKKKILIYTPKFWVVSIQTVNFYNFINLDILSFLVRKISYGTYKCLIKLLSCQKLINLDLYFSLSTWKLLMFGMSTTTKAHDLYSLERKVPCPTLKDQGVRRNYKYESLPKQFLKVVRAWIWVITLVWGKKLNLFLFLLFFL